MAKTTSFAIVILISSTLVLTNSFSIQTSVGLKTKTATTKRSLNYRTYAVQNDEAAAEDDVVGQETDFWAMQKQLAESMNASVDDVETRLKRYVFFLVFFFQNVYTRNCPPLHVSCECILHYIYLMPSF